jgi:IgGFc binding protein
MLSSPFSFRFARRTGAPGALALCALAIACGARSGLLVTESTTTNAPPGPDMARDAEADTEGPDAADPRTYESYEGGPTDAVVDCSAPTYCNPGDLDHIYQCDVPTFRCGSLEQCEAREGGAQCVNPCLDTLGSDTSNGCEFYALETDLTDEAKGVCFAVFVVNQWKTGEPARIEVSRAGQTLPVAQFARLPVGKGSSISYAPFDPNTGLPKEQVAILFLSRDPAALADPTPSNPRVLANCPAGVTPAVVGDASLHGTGKADAFRIRTNVPVVAYQMLPYGGGSARVTGATLLLPTNTWGRNYVVADAYRAPLPAMIPEDRAGPTTAIIASQDGTSVTIRPTSGIVGGGGLIGTDAGLPATYTLNRGEYLQFTQRMELTGSAVEADKPVAVIGASTLMDLPLSTPRADSAEQMLPPVQALGSEYVAARYRSRGPTGSPEETVPWRLVGVVDGTQLTYEPAPPAGAPAVIGAQQLVEFDDPGPFVVRSQDANHPFYMASYMTGGEPFGGIGDPEFVNVIPPAQFLGRYTFFTDPTYPETNLVIVRVRDERTGRMPDVTLDCAGLLDGWRGVGSDGAYEMTRVDLATGNFQGVGACDNGVHTIVANVPGDSGAGSARFGVTVWGWGNGLTWGPDEEANPKFTRWVSYGYPAGANVAPLNSAVLRAK